MKNYRIIRKNSRFGWTYTIQRQFLGFVWLDTLDQPYNQFDLIMAQDRLKEIIKRKKSFAERQKIGNGVV